MFRRYSDLPVWIPIGLVALSIGLAALVSTHLTDGWVEIPDHWWSTIAVGVPLGLAGLWWVGRRSTR